MSETSRPDSAPISPTRAGRLEKVCNQFELAWRGPSRPRIEDYLVDAPQSERSALLRELLALELEYRLRDGESPTLEEYWLRFAKESELVSAVYREAVPSGSLSRPLEGVPDSRRETQPYNPEVSSAHPSYVI